MIIDCNNVPYNPAMNYRKGRIKQVQLIVIHTMEAPDKGNTAEAVAEYFHSSGVMASAHYCVDNNSVVQCVYDSSTAFACKNANANGIHIEHAGYAAQTADDWQSDYNLSMLDLSAQVAAYVCNKYNIPVQYAEFAGSDDPNVLQPGICGHKDVPLHGSHWDPGLYFPFDTYFDLIKKYL